MLTPFPWLTRLLRRLVAFLEPAFPHFSQPSRHSIRLSTPANLSLIETERQTRFTRILRDGQTPLLVARRAQTIAHLRSRHGTRADGFDAKSPALQGSHVSHFLQDSDYADRPGMGWRKGKFNGDLPICNTRLVKYALDPRFEMFIEETKMELPESLKAVERYVENRSDCQGSPLM